VPGNSLDDIVQKTGPLQEQLVRRYVKQILLALEYCHSKGVLHRGRKLTAVVITAVPCSDALMPPTRACAAALCVQTSRARTSCWALAARSK
jgi:serine/threonine protein kinase